MFFVLKKIEIIVYLSKFKTTDSYEIVITAMKNSWIYYTCRCNR